MTAILSLTLGIGATSAVFSVIYALLGNPYPYRGANRMIELNVINEKGQIRFVGVTGPQLAILRQAKCLESVARDRWRLESDHHRRGSPRGRAVLPALRKCRRPFRSPRHARTYDYSVRCARWAGPGAGGRAQLSVLAAAFQFRPEGGRAQPSTGSKELHNRGRYAVALYYRGCGCIPADENHERSLRVPLRAPQTAARSHPRSRQC